MGSDGWMLKLQKLSLERMYREFKVKAVNHWDDFWLKDTGFQPLAIFISKLKILNDLFQIKCHLNLSEGLHCAVHECQTG